MGDDLIETAAARRSRWSALACVALFGLLGAGLLEMVSWFVELPRFLTVLGLGLVVCCLPMLFVAALGYRRAQGDGFFRSVWNGIRVVVRAVFDLF
jgi:hypothetical protein